MRTCYGGLRRRTAAGDVVKAVAGAAERPFGSGTPKNGDGVSGAGI